MRKDGVKYGPNGNMGLLGCLDGGGGGCVSCF